MKGGVFLTPPHLIDSMSNRQYYNVLATYIRNVLPLRHRSGTRNSSILTANPPVWLEKETATRLL